MNLEKLNIHLKNLAVLDETENLVISCYINNESGQAGYRETIDVRIRELRKSMSPEQCLDFEQALDRIEAFLATDVNPDAKGVALFSRSGEASFFKALQFRLPLPSLMSVDSLPHIYELAVLKDTYHRYVLLISTESHARIVEVSIGNVTKELWTERPELRKRVGREWTKDHYQSHCRDRTQKFIKEKIEILDRLLAEGAHTHLVLAGNPRMIARVRDNLPKRLQDKLVDIISMSNNHSTANVVNATLSTFAEYEQRESMETVGLLFDELKTGGLAVAGTEATLKALAHGQIDILIMSESYVPPDGWKCSGCKTVGVTTAPNMCPWCGERTIAQLNLKEEIIRSAEQIGAALEIVRNSDVLLQIGGVGCLLKYLTSEQRYPENHCAINVPGNKDVAFSELVQQHSRP